MAVDATSSVSTTSTTSSTSSAQSKATLNYDNFLHLRNEQLKEVVVVQRRLLLRA